MQTSDVTSTIVNLVTSNLYNKPWAASRRQKAFKTIARALMRHAYDTTQFNWTEVRSDMEWLAHDIIEENTHKA